ncbi:UDP-4-amino-4,6-dideoxy-N-acetyl-beta-L-altrosamine transaminase [Sulfurimonas sp.]|uniref:UDP-4-amino-4, 6-dideoxy-N-acetyl-beta-L-altrosamine transaminase n=1 Tax=Sulfurimonas sp. TaxID=2022749 RepID=UPI0039E70266
MISYSTQCIEQDDIDGVIDILKGKYLTQGKKVEEFEIVLSKYTGAKHAITFNSATTALFSAYTVSGISQDDEIITTPISFVATSNMFVTLGAKPVWCDIKMDGNIDEEKIEELISPKTKAIVTVDFAGKPVNMQKIQKIAKKYDLLLIDDASHALGSSINNTKIGSMADMTIFSFHAIKPITTSEGGAILTDNDDYAKELKRIRSHGITKKELWDSDMSSMGYNFRMTEVAGSLGVTQMKKLDSFIQKREAISTYYYERFKDTKAFSTIELDKNTISSRHLFPILLDKSLYPHKEEIFQSMQKNKINVQVHYKPIYKNSFYIEKFGKVSLPRTEDFFTSEISIPCHQKMSIEDAKYVADTLLKILNKYSRQ